MGLDNHNYNVQPIARFHERAKFIFREIVNLLLNVPSIKFREKDFFGNYHKF